MRRENQLNYAYENRGNFVDPVNRQQETFTNIEKRRQDKNTKKAIKNPSRY